MSAQFASGSGDLGQQQADVEAILQRMRADFAVLAASLGTSQLPLSSSALPSPSNSFEAPKLRRRCCSWVTRPGGRRLPMWLLNNVLLFSFLWQVIVVLLYRLVFNKAFTSEGIPFDVGVGIMVAMQFLQLLFIFVIGVKVSKQVLHRTVSSWLLIQLYVSALFFYMGLYTVLERALPLSFKGVFDGPDDSVDHEIVTIRFLYFSSAVMSTCGFGDIVPNAWYADLLVTTQMFLSVLFTAIIFSKGLLFFQQPPAPKHRRRQAENAQLIQ